MESYIKKKSKEISNNLRLSKILRKNLLTKSKNTIQYFEEDNNYIDYFIEIGVKPELFKQDFLYESSINELNIKLKPEIISKFPDINKKSIIINNNNELISQVFPHGINIVEAKEKPDPIFFSIMSDNQLYNIIYRYKYISCLIIYESIVDYRKLYILYNEEIEKEEDKNLAYKHFYIPKCLCLVSVHPYINKFDEILKTIYENTIKNNFCEIYLNQLIEEIIMKVPKIPQGYKRVYLNLNEDQIDLSEKKLNEFPSIHIDLSKLFALFKISTIIEIFKFILYEGKLIFFSSKIYDLTNIIMSFLFLLSPFEYQYQVISILPKMQYYYIESDLPYIFGINEKYNENFFIENKIDLKQKTICIIDLDEKTFETIPRKYEIKEYPEIPKHFKDIIENNIQQYYKYLINSAKKNLENVNNINNNQKEIIEYKIIEQNEKYQLIFYKFMLAFLSEYPKYLFKNKPNKENKEKEKLENDINNMIDIPSFINSLNVSDREFHKKIMKTKLFKEFIIKRCNPKNSKEKIEAIFFEEKINEKIALNKVFGKSKIMEHNKLLSSKEYDYLPEPEIIDLSKQKLFPEFIDLFKDKKFIKEHCLSKGYYIEENNNKEKSFNYKYYLFPTLFDSKTLLEFNIPNHNYPSPPLLYKHIDLINAKMVKDTSIKFFDNDIKKINYEENDLYICYIILWCLTCWYTEENERDYRFGKMLQILDKIKYQKIEVYNLIFENLNKWKYKDEDIFYVYIKYLNNKLNPSWNNFNMIFDIIQKKLNENKKVNLTEHILNLDKQNKNIIQSKISKSLEIFSKRTLKSECDYEDNIISDDVKYICYTKCIGCGKVIDIGKICSNLNNMIAKSYNGVDMIKCYNKDKNGKKCEYYNCLKLKFRYGTELFNHKLTDFSTSKYFNIPLLSPTALKNNLFKIINYYKDLDERINIDYFKKDHKIEFWNSIWYFELNGIDISFILPYSQKDKYNIDISSHGIYSPTDSNKINYQTNNEEEEEIILEKSIYDKKYEKDDLCIQIVHQFAFIKNIGMVSYKNIFLYEENINYNELPLFFNDSNLEKDNISLRESTLTRCITTRDIHETISESEYSSDIDYLKQSNKKQNQTLINSSSSPMLINNQNNQKKY